MVCPHNGTAVLKGLRYGALQVGKEPQENKGEPQSSIIVGRLATAVGIFFSCCGVIYPAIRVPFVYGRFLRYVRTGCALFRSTRGEGGCTR